MRNHIGIKFLTPALFALLSACGGGGLGEDTGTGSTTGGTTGGTTTGSGIPAAITLDTSSTSITADGVASSSITAHLVDTTNVVIKGVSLSFTSNAGTLSAPSKTTDASGNAQVFLTSGTSLGRATITVVDAASGISASTFVNFVSGPASQISMTLAPATVGFGGTTSLKVLVLDANNLPVSGEFVSLGLTTNTSGGEFSTSSLTTDSNGRATATYQAGAIAGTDVLKASLAGPQTPASGNLVVSGAVAASIGSVSLSMGSASVVADGATTTAATATVRDTSNNPFAGVSVNFSSTAGTFPGMGTATTDSFGKAKLLLTSPNAVGSATVTASVGGFSSNAAITFVAGAPSSVVVSASPTSLLPGGTASVRAVVLDAKGNRVPNSTITFSSNAPAGSFDSATVVTNASGEALAAYTAAPSGTSTETVTATASNGISGTKMLTISSASASVTGVLLTLQSGSQVAAGGTAMMRAKVTTASGTSPAGLSVNLSSSPSVGLMTATTDVNGNADFSFTAPSTPGNVDVSASIGGFSSQVTVPVVAGAASFVSLSLSRSSIGLDTSTTFNSTVLDSKNNPVSGKTVQFQVVGPCAAPPCVSSSSPVVASSNVTTLSDGTASATFTATSGVVAAGSYTVYAIVSGVMTPSSAALTVTSATASTANLALNLSSAQLLSDGSNSITVKAIATDSAGNLLAGVPVNFFFNPSTPIGGLSASQVTTDASGLATVTLTTGGDTTLRNIAIEASVNTGGAGAKGATCPATGPNSVAGTVCSAAKSVAVVGLVNSITLLASSPQLQSGASTGVLITALLKDSNNNVISGIPVSFSSTSTTPLCGTGGALTPTVTTSGTAAGTTDASGTAATTLTTGGDSLNQTIKVTATAAGKTANISVDVIGTTLKFSGVSSLGLGSSSIYTVTLADGASKGIPTQTISLTTSNGGTLGGAQPVTKTTDANGQVTVTYTTGGVGGVTDIISAATANSCNTATQSIAVSAQTLAFTAPAANTKVVIGAAATPVSVTLTGGTNSGQTITFSASRGAFVEKSTTAAFTVADSSATTISATTLDVVGQTVMFNLGTAANVAKFVTGAVVDVSDGTHEILGTITTLGATSISVQISQLVGGTLATDSMATGASVIWNTQSVNVGSNANAALFPLNSTVDITDGTHELFGTVTANATNPLTVKTVSRSTATSSKDTMASGADVAISTITAVTNGSGVATTSVQQSYAQKGVGGALLTATGPSGITATVPFTVVSSSPQTIALQATPNNIPSGTGTSTIVATVRDSKNNLVQDATVNFTFTDSSGGSLSGSTGITNSQGQASVVYSAGDGSGGRSNVVVTGTLASGSTASSSTTLTVGGQALRIVLGTGNLIGVAGTSNTLRTLPYTVLVTDSAGNPPPAGTTVSLLTESVAYDKGTYVCGTAWSKVSSLTSRQTSILLPPPAPANYGCTNEDVNRNGLLDSGEDFNSNNVLDPNSVASVPSSVVLDASGLGNFNLTYPADRAGWVQQRITAIATVAGSESTESATFELPGLASDYDSCTESPPGVVSPYGTATSCDVVSSTGASLSISSASTFTGGMVNALVFNVTLSASTSSDVTVNFNTASVGTGSITNVTCTGCTNGNPSTVTIVAGSTAATITVTTNAAYAAGDTINVTLSSPSNANLGSPSSKLLTAQ